MWQPTDRAWVYEVENAMRGLDDAIRHEIAQPTTIRQWLEDQYAPDWEFPAPTICLLNGRPLLRADWTHAIKPGEVVTFVRVPLGGDPVTWLIVAVVAIAAVVVVMSMVPDYGEMEAADSVQYLRGQRNKNRIGQPIESGYGRCRMFPAMAATAYTKFINNDQWYYGLYSLGHGDYEIEEIRIEDTDIDAFDEIEYEIYDVGETVTLFRDNVYRSGEVGEIELFAENHPSGGSDNWTSWIVANPVGTVCDKLEFDFLWPRGLYGSDSKGRLNQHGVWIEVQWREIDDDGIPTGDNHDLEGFQTIRKTTTPVRLTKEYDPATPSRFEVRVRRALDEAGDTQTGELTQWIGLKAYLENHAVYPVKTLAMKARATNNLNDRAANRLNIVGTRKLPVWNGASWSAPTATRSWIWAFVDVWRSAYGRRLPDEYIDLETMVEMDAIYGDGSGGREEYFDYVFDRGMSVWEAAKLIAEVGRAEPAIIGGKITLVRDEEKTAPVMLFNEENIYKGTFSVQAQYMDPVKDDGLEVEFVDPDTFMPEQVLCLIGDEEGDNPRQVRSKGIQDAAHAYRYGMYKRGVERYRRMQVQFETGMQAYLLTRFDAIGVAHDLPQWSIGGMVMEASDSAVRVSKDLVFSDESGAVHKIAFTRPDGTLYGPFTCTETANPRVVEVSGFTAATLEIENNREPPKFVFGVSDEWSKLCVVSEREAIGDDRVRIKAFLYRSEVFAADNDFPPGYTSLSRRDLTRPTVDALQAYHFPDNLMVLRVAWAASDWATDYVVERSEDDIHWERVAVTKNTYMDIPVSPEDTIYLRVAGVAGGVGPWKTIGPLLVGVAFDTALKDMGGNQLVDEDGNHLMGPGTVISLASFSGVSESIGAMSEQVEYYSTRMFWLEDEVERLKTIGDSKP